MGMIDVSAARVRSLLRNRAGVVETLSPALATRVLDQAQAGGDGKFRISHVELVELASAIKRPWSYLLIEQEEPSMSERGDFRRHATPAATELSMTVANAIADSLAILDVAEELFPNDSVRLPTAVVTTNSSTEDSGRALRAHLVTGSADPPSHPDEWALLRLWSDRIHASGIYYSTRPLKDPTVRGFSVREGRHAMAVVDSADSSAARLFTAVHEIAHIWLGAPGICGYEDDDAVERWCNRVAAACLLPRSIMRTADWSTIGSGDRSADQVLAEFCNAIGVSQQAVLIRAQELGLLGDDQYFTLERRRASRRRTSESASGGNFYRNVASRLSWGFAKGVVQLYESSRIDRFEAAASLGVSDWQVDGLALEVRRHGGRP